jgi:hypothetical protein
MQNTLIRSAVLSTTDAAGVICGDFVHAMPATVVKNDTTTPTKSKGKSNGSIKLETLGVPVTVSVGNTTTAVPQNKLAVMEQARMSWETTELAASNKRLYSILRDAYSYYLVLKQDPISETRKARAAELDEFIAQRKYTFMPSTHDMTRVVKCVFGVDRRRVSAYSIALREALRQQIAAADLVAFIEVNGGVEQIRMGGSKPLSVIKRAAKAADEVLGTELGMLKFDPKLMPADADWTDKQVVIVATYLPTGEFQANAVIRHDGAVNTALAAFYSQQQAKDREQQKIAKEAEGKVIAEAKAAEKAIKQATQAAEKQQKQARQAAIASLTKEAQITSEKNLEHFNTLFEGLSS